MDDALPVNSVHRLSHRFCHRDVQHGEILKDSRQEAVVFLPVPLANVCTVEEHPPLVRVVEAAQEFHHRGFARAVEAHNGQLFSGMNGQVEIVQGVLRSAGIAEGYVLHP